MKFLKQSKKAWNVYRYRFFPWIRINLTKPGVITYRENKVIKDDEVLHQLITIFSTLNNNKNCDPNKILHEVIGFQVIRQDSNIPDGGTGVFISKGKAKMGQIVSIYPGTVYLPSDVMFFQSIANKFIFRCSDCIHIDGKNTGVSKTIFKSCSQRDKIGLYSTSDLSWMNINENMICPLNVGQFINNKSKCWKANVQYQEYNISYDFPLELRQYIPNVNVSGLHCIGFLRTVVLVALRDISAGEELFSDYFTVIK